MNRVGDGVSTPRELRESNMFDDNAGDTINGEQAKDEEEERKEEGAGGRDPNEFSVWWWAWT